MGPFLQVSIIKDMPERKRWRSPHFPFWTLYEAAGSCIFGASWNQVKSVQLKELDGKEAQTANKLSLHVWATSQPSLVWIARQIIRLFRWVKKSWLYKRGWMWNEKEASDPNDIIRGSPKRKRLSQLTLNISQAGCMNEIGCLSFLPLKNISLQLSLTSTLYH